MFPRIVELEILGRQVGLNSYGLMAAVGYLTAVWLAYRQSKRTGMDADAMLDLCFWVLVSSLVGSRVMYVLANLDLFAKDWTAVFWVWEGGLVYYGGLGAALAAGAVVVRVKGLSFLRAADVLAPVIALGHAFGRVGCFAVGCCWGKVCGCGWGARFGPESVAFQDMVRLGRLDPVTAEATAALHPVQLYEASGELAIFAALLYVARRKLFNGYVFLVYVMFYSVLRFLTEILRADPTRKYVAQLATPGFNRLLGLDPAQPCFLSTSQLFSIVASPAAVALIIYLRKRTRAAQAETP
jgi:phosphatidylglycerol:prolipoprotein diacylglycerol transferase